MDPRSIRVPERRLPWIGLTPFGVVNFYIVGLFFFLYAFFLRPESRLIETLLYAWIWPFLVLSVVLIVGGMIVMIGFGLAICWSARGRSRGIKALLTGSARSSTPPPSRPHPLWDRWTDG